MLIFQATAETLRRQVKDELHTKTVLVARINSDSTDLVKYKKDTVQKRDKVKIITFKLTLFVIKIK